MPTLALRNKLYFSFSNSKREFTEKLITIDPQMPGFHLDYWQFDGKSSYEDYDQRLKNSKNACQKALLVGDIQCLFQNRLVVPKSWIFRHFFLVV